MKGKFIVYSLVAALVIVGCTFLVGIQFRVGYTNLIALATFCFAFFTYSLDHYFDALHAKDKDHLHQRHQVSDSAYKMTLKGLVLTALCSLYFFSFLPRMYLFTGVFYCNIVRVCIFLFYFKIFTKSVAQAVDIRFYFNLGNDHLDFNLSPRSYPILDIYIDRFFSRF